MQYFKTVNWIRIILWFSVYVLFVYIEFGVVYLLLSIFGLLWWSLDRNPTKTGPSAYSVFNKDAQSIPGTFTPHLQFWKPEEKMNTGEVFFDKEEALTKKGTYSGTKVSRNTLCPCKSGEKYKKCCGDPSLKNVQAASDTESD